MGSTAAQELRIDRTTTSDLTMLTLAGTVDASLLGGKVAAGVRTRQLIVNLRDVRRFASWGMAEWMNFLKATSSLDLYFIECSSYAVQQMNLVAGLFGHGKLVSFYIPFRCNSCSEEFDSLVLIGHDNATRELISGERTCPTCGGTARMTTFAEEIVTSIGKRPPLDIQDEVVEFLRSRFKYDLAINTRRFRAHGKQRGASTYVRLSGDLAKLPGTTLADNLHGTVVLDLVAVTYAPTELDAWRSFVQVVLPNVTTLQLLDCPADFVRHAIDRDTLQSKVKIRTFVLRYHCTTCAAITPAMVDVAENLEQLTVGIVPPRPCSVCKAETRADIEDATLRQLPARERDTDLDELISKTRTESPERLTNYLVAKIAKPARQASIARSAFIGSLLAALVVGGAVAAVLILKKDPENQPTSELAIDKPKPTTTFQRPDWVTVDAPLSGLCVEQTNRLVCVGVSSNNKNRAEAVTEANDAALEELVNTLGLKIKDSWFRTNVLSSYTSKRGKLLSALQDAEVTGADTKDPAKYATTVGVVQRARHRVVEALRTSGGAAVPAQRSDWYWEEYVNDKGAGTEFLVFVRYDLPLDAQSALVQTYSAVTEVKGSSMMTAYPSLGWESDEFTGGAVLIKAASDLEAAGLKPRQLIIAVGDERVTTAEQLRDRLATHTGAVQLTVKSAGTSAHTVIVSR